MEEIWKDIEGYEGIYQVSNLGRVRSLDRVLPKVSKFGKIIMFPYKGKFLADIFDEDGYKQVSLCFNGVQKEFKIHRLVAMTFLDKVDGKLFVNHKNCIKIDNSVENLEWCTQAENDKHAKDNGRLVGLRGDKNPNFGKNRKDFPLKRIILDLQTGIFYDTIREAANCKSINFSSLRKMMGGCKKNKTSLVYV